MPARPPVTKTYDLYADMSYADLGGSPEGSASGMTGPRAGQLGERTSKTRRPAASSSPLTTDLGTNSPDTETEWRSEASALGRRARALSGALTQLDRSGSSADGGPRAADTGNSASGDASTASTGGPHGPGDTPDPPPNPEQVPVDGGLGWLAAAGAAYAANRLRKQQNGGETDDEA